MNSATQQVTKVRRGRAKQLLVEARKRFTREDLEIGVLPAVAWGDLVAVIDVAESVGFGRWQLVDHDLLGPPPEE